MWRLRTVVQRGACIAVESLPRAIASEPSSPPSVDEVALPRFSVADPPEVSSPQPVPRAGPPRISSPQRLPAEWSPEQPDAPVRIRLDLQKRAATNLRNHALRAARRFAVLVAADLTSFGLMRELVNAVRDQAVLGAAVAARVHALLPPGILQGWQYAAALFVGLFVTGNYGYADARRAPRRLFFACALATALPLWMTVWTRGLEPVLVQYAITTFLVWVGLVAERRTIDRIVARVRSPELDRVDVLFVGPGAECQVAMQTPAFTGRADYRPIGFVDTQLPSAAGALGHISDFSLLLAASGVEAVVICGYVTDAQFREVVDTALAGGCQVLSVPRAADIAGVHPTTVWRGGQPLVSLSTLTLKGWQLCLKRMLDVVGATVGLVALAPLFGAIAAAIRLESRGQILFGHSRLGLNGGRFRCYKFRSMRSGAEDLLRSDPALYAEYIANNFKLPDGRDPRLTSVGRFLRKTSLDELPQLINVLRGDMSLVGPRPIVPQELDQYGHGAPVFLSLKPGVTGAWQINGRSNVGYPLRADIELEYVRNWSLGRDLWILLKTMPAVLAHRGAH